MASVSAGSVAGRERAASSASHFGAVSEVAGRGERRGGSGPEEGEARENEESIRKKEKMTAFANLRGFNSVPRELSALARVIPVGSGCQEAISFSGGWIGFSLPILPQGLAGSSAIAGFSCGGASMARTSRASSSRSLNDGAGWLGTRDGTFSQAVF